MSFPALAEKSCSTESANPDCTLAIDRLYPVTPPTIQMKRGATMTVKVSNPLPFETITLDLQSAQAVQGSDQVAALIPQILTQLKPFIASQSVQKALTPKAPAQNPGSNTTFWADYQTVSNNLDKAEGDLTQTLQAAVAVYAEIQKAVGTPPTTKKASGVASSAATNAPPDIWTDFGGWRKWMLCALNGDDCQTTKTTQVQQNTVGQALSLTKELATCTDKPPAISSSSLDCQFAALTTEFGALSTGDRAIYGQLFTALQQSYMSLQNAVLNASSISNMGKDLASYYVSIKELGVSASNDPFVAGAIGDPSKKQYAQLGRVVQFNLNGVNLISNAEASVPAASAKKVVVTINVLFSDPVFEASAGTFFSWLPNRSFANQISVTQSGNQSVAGTMYTINQTTSKPTAVPFVAGNWRLGSSFQFLGRRGAVYATAAVGINPNTTTTEFAVGPSLSWRMLMVSAFWHFGRDLRLTQGEQVGQTWAGSGTPPTPSTQRYWKGSFAIGISIRVPTTFGSTSSK